MIEQIMYIRTFIIECNHDFEIESQFCSRCEFPLHWFFDRRHHNERIRIKKTLVRLLVNGM